MKEDITEVKLSMPLIDNIELEKIDNFYNNIVDEYTKMYVKEKDQIITQQLMKKLREENKQLEFNWKELKKSIEYKLRLAEENDVDDEELKGFLIQRRDTFKEILNVMQKLESGNNE